MNRVTEFWGLFAIYETRQAMNVSCGKCMQNMSNLDIMAFGLKSFRSLSDKLVRDRVQNGAKIRILSPHPASEFVRQREYEENEATGQISNTIIELHKWIVDLQNIAPNKQNVCLKYYASLPQDFYFRVDDTVYIGPYLYKKDSQQTISYEYVAPSKGFDYYTEYFESLWEDDDFARIAE